LRIPRIKADTGILLVEIFRDCRRLGKSECSIDQRGDAVRQGKRCKVRRMMGACGEVQSDDVKVERLLV